MRLLDAGKYEQAAQLLETHGIDHDAIRVEMPPLERSSPTTASVLRQNGAKIAPSFTTTLGIDTATFTVRTRVGC